MVKRTVDVEEDLFALARDILKLRQEPPEIAGRQGEEKTIAGPIR